MSRPDDELPGGAWARSAFLCAAGLLAACDTSPAADPDAGVAPPIDAFVAPAPEVTTPLGTVRGMRGDGFQAFLGIPYAEPPVGALRWRAPVASGPWDGVLDGVSTPAACPQEALGLTSSGEEDCLFVNVHTPDPRPTGAPVLVWIHGGAFVFGEGLQLDRGTAGDLLASQHDLVVVSMNYRLGVFGFLADSGLGSSGNEGFEDQQLALQWVRDNVASFGGDPNNVTIAGESAGGLSVCLHLVAPGSRGLFQRAITESGLCDTVLPTYAAQEAVSQLTIEAAGCATATDVPACMRGKTTDELQAAGALGGDTLDILTGDARRFWPTIDGTVVPAGFREQVLGGEVAEVPVILGWNRDEGTLFIGLAESQGAVIDEAAYHRVVASIAVTSGVEVAAIEAAYPIASYSDPGAALAAVLGHFSLACPSRRAARLLAEHGSQVFTYRFEYPGAGFQLNLEREMGAFHSAEIQFVFGHPARLGRRAFTGAELPLHQAMSGYWAGFVTDGDPGGDVAWPAYALDTDRHLVLDTTIRAETAADRDACVLWDPL